MLLFKIHQLFKTNWYVENDSEEITFLNKMYKYKTICVRYEFGYMPYITFKLSREAKFAPLFICHTNVHINLGKHNNHYLYLKKKKKITITK